MHRISLIIKVGNELIYLTSTTWLHVCPSISIGTINNNNQYYNYCSHSYITATQLAIGTVHTIYIENLITEIIKAVINIANTIFYEHV